MTDLDLRIAIQLYATAWLRPEDLVYSSTVISLIPLLIRYLTIYTYRLPEFLHDLIKSQPSECHAEIFNVLAQKTSNIQLYELARIACDIENKTAEKIICKILNSRFE